MNKVRITAVRQTVYRDLMARYENPIEHACHVHEGDSWTSVDGLCPEGLCLSAWESMHSFVEALARGEEIEKRVTVNTPKTFADNIEDCPGDW